MIKQYQNKEWLEKKYIGERLSAGQIAGLCKINAHTIYRWLNNFDIHIRSLSEVNKGRILSEEWRKKISKAMHLNQVNHCKLSKKAIDWIQGELLGDGCLQSSSPYSARFSYRSKYLEYAQYVSDILKSFGIFDIKGGKIYKEYHKKMDCYTYRYVTLSYEELLPIRLKWYPKGKKVIPKDIKLTSLATRQWFIGDGSLTHHQKGRPFIRLATCGFTIPDVEWLIKQLIELGFKATRQLCNNSINISTHSTKAFLNYIGICPVNCYQYKWEY